MAIYQRFEDLPVWQEAARLYNSALDLLQSQKLLLSPGWRFQFERAALSVSNNIRAAYTKRTKKFPGNRCGSAGEIRSMVGVVVRRREMQPHVSQLQGIRTTAESCARQLGAWIKTIDNPKQSRKPARPRNSHDRTID